MKKKSIPIFFLLVMGLGVETAWSFTSELRPLYRGTRATALGGAYVGLADDEQAIYLNPAGLAPREGLDLYPMIWDLELSTGIYESYKKGKFSDISDVDISTINRFIGDNYFFKTQFSPSIIFNNFGVSLLYDGQIALYSANKANPEFVLGAQETYGVQMATGFTVLKSKAKKREMRVGVGAKYMYRRGGYRRLNITNLINKLNTTYAKNLMGDGGGAWGADVGVQYFFPLGKRLQLSAASSITNIGHLRFKNDADRVDQNFTIGAAALMNLRHVDVNFAYDYGYITADIDWRKKVNFGAELRIPLMRFMAGIHQMNFSYGYSLDLIFMKMQFVSYAEELLTQVGQKEDRRYLIQFSF